MKKIIVVLVLLVIIAAGGVLGYNALNSDKIGREGGAETGINIPKGSGASAIARLLKNGGVIKYEFYFLSAVRESGRAGEFKQGAHTFRQDMGYAEVIRELLRVVPQSGEVRVTIPEGYELHMIADRLREAGLISPDKFYDEVQNGDFDYWFLEGLPDRPMRLEGYLFPDTYFFDINEGEWSIINTMLNRFGQIFSEEYRQRAAQLDMTADQVITLASIIEREAMSEDDRDLVASVFHNRLSSNSYSRLESCATVQYILKERKPKLSIQDTRIESPYNTYRNSGLPLGPIASPGKPSINAALYPAESDYLFFRLSDTTGVHVFSRTLDEHNSVK